jgi:hypothetical protein
MQARKQHQQQRACANECGSCFLLQLEPSGGTVMCSLVRVLFCTGWATVECRKCMYVFRVISRRCVGKPCADI